MDAIRIIDAHAELYDAILALNDAEVPHVNRIDEDDLARLHGESFSFRVAVDDTGLVGFLLSMDQSATYESPNFRWFQREYERFVYIDRVIVAPRTRGQGVGRQLYADLMTLVRGQTPRLSCEVNLRPPNPGSLAFHHALGFSEVGQQDTEGGAKRVSMLVHSL